MRNLCIFEMCDISNPENLIVPIGAFHNMHIRVAAYTFTQSRRLLPLWILPIQKLPMFIWGFIFMIICVFEAFDHQRLSTAQIFYGLGAVGSLMLILIDLKVRIGERRKLVKKRVIEGK